MPWWPWRRRTAAIHSEERTKIEPETDLPLLRRAGPLGEVPAERLFTEAAMRRAWRAVRRAGGGAGVDSVTIEAFEANLDEELRQLRQELIEGSYRPRPVRQVLVPKASGGLRPLAMWALRDRVAQRIVYDLIAPSFEAIFLPCSFGFRLGLGVEDAVRQVIAYRDEGLRWVVDADIKNCFDEIDPHRLMRLVARRVRHRLLRRYIRGWLEAKIFNSADGLPRHAGASQGSVLSPLLANVYLHEFDLWMTRRQLALVRYADDFVVCCRKRRDAEEAVEVAQEGLQRLRLSLNPAKSRVTHFDQGFAWLGYFFVRNECYRLQ
ncbi:MAG: hypothetical protein Kow0047_31480 [Anaerolineae bacterium]